MNKNYVALAVMMSVLMVAMPAFAAASAAVSLANSLLVILSPIILMTVVWLAHRLVKAFEAKTGIDVPDDWEASLDSVVAKGVNYAEQKAKNFLDEHDTALAGPEKLELALHFVLDLAEQYKLPDLAKDKLIKLIEAHLGGLNAAAPAEEAAPALPETLDVSNL